MPIPLFKKALLDGIDSVPEAGTLLKVVPVLFVLYLLKVYFSGASNTSERNMHGKVVMITGGTSGIGNVVLRELATRGAQIVLLTQHDLDDFFLVEYIEEMRARTDNDLITAAQVDLTSLHSIRQFATKWVDNAPPRRLDMIILCANTLTPKGSKIQKTDDDVELNWAVNYLSNFHLLSILSPAIRAQPPDRDVRIILATCSSYIGGQLPISKSTKDDKTAKLVKTKVKAEIFNPASAYATSKLALMTFAQSFQKHLTSYDRPDKSPMNARVILADPGYTRTPGMRRYLTRGSLIGLAIYLVTYPLWWLILKSPEQGAQTILFAAMEAEYGRGTGGWYLKEVRELSMARKDVTDEAVQKELWEYSENIITEAEKRGAKKRAEVKAKEAAKTEKKGDKKGEKKEDKKGEKKEDKKEEKKTRSRRSEKA